MPFLINHGSDKRGSCKKIVMPEGFYPASRFAGIYKLDSGQKPAGMTDFWTFARASRKSQKQNPP